MTITVTSVIGSCDIKISPSAHILGFPGGSDGRESARNAGDLGLNPGSGRSPGEGNDYPLQYSCLENSMDRGKEQGKRDEVPYVEAFILLHQEKKESEDYHLMM